MDLENRLEKFKLVFALLLLGVAGAFLYGFLRGSAGVTGRSFYYDLSERKLFVGPRQGIPPIRGINDAQEDAVRAVVVSTNGRPADKSSWKIVYLEKYTPELKRQMEQAQKSGSSPAMGRQAAQSNRLVRREQDTVWHPLDTPEGEQIVNAWITWGADGGPAVICSP